MLAFQDLVAKPADIGVLFPLVEKQFLVRQPNLGSAGSYMGTSGGTNGHLDAGSQEQRIAARDVLVRLPSLRESKWRVTVLQRWVGRVERVESDRFFAVVDDATNPQNPPELVELDRREVSKSDLPLLAEGAAFYWSIGYRDTPGGQRERTSTLRFARRPHLSKTDVKRIFEQADISAALLEGE